MTDTATETTLRDAAPLRADAARNRERIICAAATAYATGGPDVSLEEIAHLAGVGVGTVYRRFPTKQSLLEALLEETMCSYAAHAEQMAELAKTDPWHAFSEHVTFLLSAQACNLTFSALLRRPEQSSPGFREQHLRALAASGTLVRIAKRAGVLCPGFRHDDLLLMRDANHGIVQNAGADAHEASARFATYILESFRARPPRASAPQA